MFVSVPKQQLDPVLGQLRKVEFLQAGISKPLLPFFSPQDSPGRQSSPSTPPSPSRRCPPWPGSSRRWKNKVRRSRAPSRRAHPGAHTAPRSARSRAPQEHRWSRTSPHAPQGRWAGRGSAVFPVPARSPRVRKVEVGSALTPLSPLCPRARQRGALQVRARRAGGC